MNALANIKDKEIDDVLLSCKFLSTPTWDIFIAHAQSDEELKQRILANPQCPEWGKQRFETRFENCGNCKYGMINPNTGLWCGWNSKAVIPTDCCKHWNIFGADFMSRLS
jgi:hypothetical protein